AAVGCAPVSSVATSSHGQCLHPAALNAARAVGGAVALRGMAVATGGGLRLPRDAMSWAAVVYLAIVGSVVAFLIYFSLLKTWDSTTVSFFAVFTPIIAILLGTVILGEHLSLWSVAGSALILSGVSLTLLPARRRLQ